MNIFNVLRQIIISGINAVAGILPSVDTSVATKITDSVDSIRTAIAQGAYYFPVNHLFTYLKLILAIEVGFLTYRLVRNIIGMLSLGKLK